MAGKHMWWWGQIPLSGSYSPNHWAAPFVPFVFCWHFFLLLCWQFLPYLRLCSSAITTKSSFSLLGINCCCHQLLLVNITWSPLCFTLSWFILPETHQYIQGRRYKEREFCLSILYVEKSLSPYMHSWKGNLCCCNSTDSIWSFSNFHWCKGD